MKWFRILCAAAVLGLLSCSNPAGPKYPESDEENPKPNPDDDQKSGFLPAPPVNITFLV